MSNVQLAQNIVKRFWNRTWPKPIKYIGGGANGKVYEGNNGRLIKFIANRNPEEFKALQGLQGTHVVPRHGPKNSAMFKLRPYINANRVHRNMFPNLANTPTNMTIVVMGKVGGNKGMTLSSYLRKYPANKANVQRRVEYLVEQMHLKGWAHGNLHSGNIIVSVSPAGRITGMWVIDFGRAYKLNGQTEREAFMKLKYDPAYKSYATGMEFNRGMARNVPTRGSPLLRRANVHMMNVHYGKRIEPAQEQKWRNTRKFALNEIAKYLKSPKKRTSTPRSARSAPRTKPKPRRRMSA